MYIEVRRVLFSSLDYRLSSYFSSHIVDPPSRYFLPLFILLLLIFLWNPFLCLFVCLFVFLTVSLNTLQCIIYHECIHNVYLYSHAVELFSFLFFCLSSNRYDHIKNKTPNKIDFSLMRLTIE